MKVFHSSTEIINHPDTLHSRKHLDFGPGFYVTTMRTQAETYAQRFLRRNKPAYINSYELKYDPDKWKSIVFDKYNEQWLDFVSECRSGNIVGDYDIITGGIANDKVFRTIDLYFSGDITKEECLKRLIYEKPNNQICIRTQKMIDQCLSFEKHESL